MSGASVRAASAADIPAILRLLGELGRPAPRDGTEEAAFGRIASRYSSDADKGLLVAAGDGGVVGMAAAVLLPRLNRGSPEMYLPELAVAGGSRGRGIGGELLGACVRLARERGCHRIRLESGNGRRAAHGFYSGAGFEQHALSFAMDL